MLEVRNFHQKRIMQKTFTRKHPRVGEIVFVMDENVSRGEWKLGLVTELIEDPDKVIRSVRLRAGKSDVERSINKYLIPLELDEDDVQTRSTDGRNCNPSTQHETNTKNVRAP